MKVQLAFIELEGNDGGSRQGQAGRGDFVPEAAQVFVEPPHLFWLPTLPEAQLLFPFVLPIQGEPVKKGRVLIVAAYTHELPLPILIGLLEDRMNGPPADPIEVDP